MLLFNRLTILYGSETGNCQDLAKLISWSISRLKNGPSKVEVMPCDEYPVESLLEEQLILFVCSTTGVGEEPLNMKKFWKFLLRKTLPPDMFSELKFAVIGLGDSSYQKYNFMAKKLNKRLLNLGAKSILDLVLGDDQHELGPFVKIDPWLRDFYQLISEGNNDVDELMESSFLVEFLSKTEKYFNGNALEDFVNNVKFNELFPFTATITRNERVTNDDHFQDVRLLSLKIDDRLPYQLFDVCVVYSENTDADVDAFLSLFNESENRITADQMFVLKANSQSWIPKSSFYYHLLKYQNPCSVRQLVKRYLDINSIPKRSFFDLFYRFSRDQLERDMLKRFASGSDLDELYDYVNRPRRTILEVMADFPHTSPYVPFPYWFDLIPAITPRPYSIASSPITSPNQIDLLYAVVNFRTRLRKPRLGQCTFWLSQQEPSTPVSIYLRPSSFSLPQCEIPVIMICAGTGVAPFRALIQNRTEQSYGHNYLFFGCRYPTADFYLRDEWASLEDRGLMKLFTAFSRQDPDRKTYVQHVVWRERDLVYRLIAEMEATVLVAGKAQQFPQLVRDTLVDIFKEKVDPKHGEAIVTKLEITKRIQFECW